MKHEEENTDMIRRHLESMNKLNEEHKTEILKLKNKHLDAIQLILKDCDAKVKEAVKSIREECATELKKKSDE